MLITGFEPFADLDKNPSSDLAEDLAIFFDCEHIILPVSYEAAFLRLKPFLENEKNLVIELGLAQKRNLISIETRAQNKISCSLSDNDGVKVVGQKISQAPEELYTPISKSEIKALCNSNIELSEDCGTYVCNYLYFKTLEAVPELKSLFIHVPWPSDWGKGFASTLEYKQIFSELKKTLETLRTMI